MINVQLNRLKILIDQAQAALEQSITTVEQNLINDINGKVNRSGDTMTGSLTLPNGTSINEFSTDPSLSDSSDDAVPTENAVSQFSHSLFPFRNLVFITSSGNWLVPANVTRIFIEVCGGGGGGSGSSTNDNNHNQGGSGGAAGEVRIALISVTPGQNIPITIGGGGSAGTSILSGTDYNGSSGGAGGNTLVGAPVNITAGGGGGGTTGSLGAPGGVVTVGSGGILIISQRGESTDVSRRLLDGTASDQTVPSTRWSGGVGGGINGGRGVHGASGNQGSFGGRGQDGILGGGGQGGPTRGRTAGYYGGQGGAGYVLIRY